MLDLFLPCKIVKQHGYTRIVRSPYQMCAEMLSLLRTPAEQLKWTSKREKSVVKAVRKGVRGAPELGGSRPSDRALPAHPLYDRFDHRFLAF